MSRFIKYTGYGNAAGLLAARGLFTGSKDSGVYSEDEDSDTEEYREAKAQSVATAQQPHLSQVLDFVHLQAVKKSCSVDEPY